MSDTEGLPTVDGFRFAGIACGIKQSGDPDLGLIVADEVVSAAALFTRNLVKAAPVILAADRIERGRARAILVNSGNANACTGSEGVILARSTTEAVAAALNADVDTIIPASTGIIGRRLPAERMEGATEELIADLSPDGAHRFARAIMTTDRWPKTAHRKVPIAPGIEATIVGIAKGAGMIHPDMATTLAFVVTDAPTHSSFLNKALRRAAEETFNAMTVDGETSTNDTIVAMASGKLPIAPIGGSDREAKVFMAAVQEVLEELSKSIVKDGEGAEHVVRLEVLGAPSEDAAKKIAQRVAGSLLVKTAIHGCDPNWGRILSAAGTAGVSFDLTKVELRIGNVVLVKKGTSTGGDAEQRAAEVMREAEYVIRLRLSPGNANAHYTFCDLGHEYVRINAEYRS
jgi:glutamate N-acetyltransferase/amino-acid N-acetyltransferase